MPFGTKIYYTLNGDDPDKDDTLYNGKIKIDLIEEQTNVIPLKVIIYYNDEYSQIYQRTYILDKDIENRFDLSVISITSDSYNLYDYYNGILVGGATLDENRKTDPESTTGNYNNRDNEWYRDCHVNMFTPQGESIIDGEYEIMCAGGGSAQIFNTKSLKIKINNENKINFRYNEELSKQNLINEYNSLRFRTGGQDIIRNKYKIECHK